MRERLVLDGMGRVRLYPERERCALCGKALLRPGKARHDICRACENAMTLEEFI